MKPNYFNKEYLDPFEATEIAYWTHRWKVTPQQVYDAIIDTGSFRVRELEKKVSPKAEALTLWKRFTDFIHRFIR